MASTRRVGRANRIGRVNRPNRVSAFFMMLVASLLCRAAGGNFRPSDLVNVVPVTSKRYMVSSSSQNQAASRSSSGIVATRRTSLTPQPTSPPFSTERSNPTESQSSSSSVKSQTVAQPLSAAPRQSTVMAAADATRRSRELRIARTFAWQWNRWNRRKALPIRYHGGWVMAKIPIKVFIIYYGSWSMAEVNIVENFVYSLSNNNTTPKDSKAVSAWQWWRIATWYTMKKGGQTHVVSSQVQFRKRVFDKYSLGKVITDDLGGVWQIIDQQLRTQALPIDSSAQYLVLTSADVSLGDPEKGFCGRSGYCGFHSFATDGVSYIKYGFIGNGDKCGTRCVRAGGRKKTPNGKRGVDGMISIIAHEMVETATNPRIGGGWYDALGAECSDKCMTDFGPSVVVGDMYNYNMVGQSGMQWLVESNWRPVEPQGCVMARY
ncbi:hypothetical protein CLOM_g1441 [Closterium sp. NIES-68]|nr:hypothetical protein CLOM_g21975 [Closterium sp. NIES-68]GJP41796.1 hypothetical protein CLOM_g1441 [Closterium sp. NIES-68]GJP68912.1 hypothetical protein CLOP_g25553 [Closterium sp. NIES-67]GJP72879.1 hypothetical protein CLOP_g3641 [Closterium sp. NIES-67]